MRLLYIHQYFKFPDQSGGTRSYDLATSFVKRRINVSVISSMTDNEGAKGKWTEFEREGIKFYMFNCPYNNKMSFKDRIKAFISFMWHATIKAQKINCDCILATSTPLTIAVPALLRKWVKKTPFIFEVRDVWPEVPIKMGFIKNEFVIKLLYLFERIIYKNAFTIIPLSTGMDINIKKRYPNNKSIVIPNISEVSRFSEIKEHVKLNLLLDGKKVILYAGTFGNVNGLKYVVDLAYATFSIDESVCYLLFGDGKEKQDVKEYAMRKGVLSKNFFLFDSVRKQELPYLYSIALVGTSFVIDNSSLWDNSANKFFDALAAGKPIVINYLGWQADEIRKSNIGYVLPPKISVEAAKSFVEYISDVQLIKEQGKNALDIARNKYSLEIAVDKYISILKKLDDNV